MTPCVDGLSRKFQQSPENRNRIRNFIVNAVCSRAIHFTLDYIGPVADLRKIERWMDHTKISLLLLGIRDPPLPYASLKIQLNLRPRKKRLIRIHGNSRAAVVNARVRRPSVTQFTLATRRARDVKYQGRSSGDEIVDNAK